MVIKQKISDITGLDKKKIPGSYQVLGHVLLAKFNKDLKPSEKKKISQAFMRFIPHLKTVGEIKGVKGELRQPKVVKITGNGFETVHKEYGLLFSMDASKIMFSKGNHFERQRLIKDVKSHETILDMFAGIGYFSLGIAKKARHVIAIEKNDLSFSYLLQNIALNKIRNMTAINEDCRAVDLPIEADRIVMGYYPKTEQFLETAKKFCNEDTIIHFHNTYHKSDLWKKTEQHLKDFEILSKKIVKPSGPNIFHVVVDAKVK
ncbi:MAG: hypothetical protein HY513_04525 [Candidatus Aenigmarchaeota archaeon]|nr:hypothetical protein [Candidatus Aenigmarchaeota archaeon]